MMDWYDGGPGGGGWVVMMLMMWTFWGVLVLGGLAVYRSSRRDDASRPAAHGDAVRLLDERFARGEIDADEYTQRRELLQR